MFVWLFKICNKFAAAPPSPEAMLAGNCSGRRVASAIAAAAVSNRAVHLTVIAGCLYVILPGDVI